MYIVWPRAEYDPSRGLRNTAILVGRSGEAIATKSKQKYSFDVGFDLGGPIVKDKVWFYIGFQPTFTTQQYDRFIRERSALNAGGMMGKRTLTVDDLTPEAETALLQAFHDYVRAS